jgi:4-amino-4-deoxy-L-arabinose transferase-like glycosyltransferase
VAALALAVVGMTPDLDGEFRRGWLGHNGARYAHIARNYARDGFTLAGGAPRFDVAGADGSAPDVYAHHPPGVTLLTGLVFRVVGVSERAARLVSVAATLAGLALLFALVRRVAGGATAGYTALLCAALPMTLVYGTHVEVQGPHVLAAGLAVLWAYDRWRAGGTAWPWVGALVIASAFDWFGLYYGAACVVHAALAPPRRLGAAVAMGAALTAVFAAWVLWLGNLPGMTLGAVFQAAGVRVGGGAGAELAEAPSLMEGLDQQLGELGPLLPGLPVLLLAALAVLIVGRLSSPPDPDRSGCSTRWLVGALLAPPLIHAVVFPAGLVVHSYWLFALPPALALAAAVVLVRVWPGGALLVVVTLVIVFNSRLPQARQPEDRLPSMVGISLGLEVPEGELVLTNYEANPLRWGEPGGAYHVRLPEVTFYADRAVRGGVDRPERLEEALARLPSAGWFLLAPFPAPPDPQALEGALAARSEGPPRVLSEDPVVRLYRLAR